MLGPGNEEAALEALSVWPNGLQVGGGISKANGQKWLGSGAEKVRCLISYAHVIKAYNTR